MTIEWAETIVVNVVIFCLQKGFNLDKVLAMTYKNIIDDNDLSYNICRRFAHL